MAEASGSRTAAVVLLSQPNGGAFFFQFFPPFLAFPSYISVPLLFDSFPPLFGLFSLRFSFFFSFSLFSPFSLFRVSFFSSVFFVFSSLLSVLLPPTFLGSIYRAKGVAFYCSHGEQPAGRPLGATAKVRPPSPVFWQVRGGWSAIVFGRWAPGERGKKIQIKASFFFLPRCMFGGKKKDEQCRSKRHRSALFFFSFFFCIYETASFWRKRAVSFKYGARTRQIPNQPLNHLFSFNCIPANFGLRPSCWPRFSL